MTQPTFGRKIDHDPRNRAYGIEPTKPVRSILWNAHGTALDQGQTSSCTGHALAHFLNTRTSRNATPAGSKGGKGTPLATHADALTLYSLGTQNDPFPGDFIYPPAPGVGADDGSTAGAVCKGGVKLGYLTGYRWAFGLDHATQALMDGPLMLGVNWYTGMMRPDHTGRIVVSGEVVGGHEVLLDGYDATRKAYRIRNSWGRGWGLSGRAWLVEGDLRRLLAEQGDVVRPVRGAVQA